MKMTKNENLSSGGRTVRTSMEMIEEASKVLVEIARKYDVKTKGSIMTIAKHVPEFEGIHSGLLVDIVNFAHEKILKNG
jgi:hypothetical protein